MQLLIACVGLIIVIGLSYLVSSNKSQIRWKSIGIMLVLQFVLGFFLLRTSVGTFLVASFAKLFDYLLEFAASGVNFVFAGVANKGSAPFFLNVLMPIVFISAIIGILRYIKILPLFIKYVGLAISYLNGMGKLESYNGVASGIFGQSEVFISYKKELKYLSEKRLLR